ncbi:MAG: ATP-binding protein [Sphingomonas fennica]
MIVLDRTGAAVLAAIAIFWVATAVWATILGVRRSTQARASTREARRLASLIAAAPAMPLVVDAEGRVEQGERLGRWLGLATPPAVLADLADPASGLSANDVEALARDVAATRRSGRGFARAVTMAGSGQVLLVRGQPEAGGRRIVLWFIDMTDSEREIERLGAEVLRLRGLIDILSTLIEAAPFPMWHRGPDLRLALVNGAYVRAVDGESAVQVVRQGLELLEAGNARAALGVAAARGAIGEVTSRTAPAIIAGERRMIRIVDVPLGDAGIAGYALDVEELEEARADLRRFVGAQRDMLDRLSAAVAQFAPDYSLAFYNAHFLQLFPIDPEWLADRPAFDRLLEGMREVQRVPEVRDFPGWKAERRGWFLGTDATEEAWLLPGGIHLRVVAQPLPDGGLLLILEDRTEHLQLASARDTLLRVRAATFDNLFEAVGVFAADGRLQLWNSRFRDVWQLGDAELARKPHVDMLVQAIAPQLADASRAGLVRELVRIATVDRQQRAGRLSMADGRFFEFAAVPLPDGNALFALLDVTASRGIEQALRDRNEALEQADRIKTAFVANMSYELRVPLTSIAGFAEMLDGGYAGELPDTAREYVTAITSAVGRLGQLIGDVLDLSQSEAGALPLARDAVPVAPLIRTACEASREHAGRRRTTIMCDIDAEDLAVTGDAVRLAQCLDHLLRNAVAYTQRGGQVAIRAAGANGRVEISVRDNGPGIAREEIRRIFTRKERAKVTAPREGSGGIGLPLVRQLVEAHGGTLRLLSDPGRGTAAIIDLPAAPEPAADQPA